MQQSVFDTCVYALFSHYTIGNKWSFLDYLYEKHPSEVLSYGLNAQGCKGLMVVLGVYQ